jgi:hypothetical protein
VAPADDRRARGDRGHRGRGDRSAVAVARRPGDPDAPEALDLLYRARQVVGRDLGNLAQPSALLERAILDALYGDHDDEADLSETVAG